MNELILEWTKKSAFYLWEYSGHESALSLWYCAEYIAHFLEQVDCLEQSDLDTMAKKPVKSPEYTAFIRELAFRIYIFTNNEDAIKNWFIAENLIHNGEWCYYITKLASEYRKVHKEDINSIRSEDIRAYYVNNN